MKRIKFVLPILLVPTMFLPIVSCSKLRTEGKLTLFSYSDPSVVGIDGKDFWLTAEPVTTSKIKVHNLTNVGNVQNLYGDLGYNQSVLVCKKTLIDSNPKYLNQVKQSLQANHDFVKDTNNRTNIINSINANLTSGKTETLTLNNTTTRTLVNCNSKYVEYEEDKQSYSQFLTKAKQVDKEIPIPSNINDFYRGFPIQSSITQTKDYKIICPDGAPAVGLSHLLCNKNTLCNNTSFEFITPGNIMMRIGKDKPDLAVLPSNLAVKLYNDYNQEYVWLSTITWGNLYILSKDYKETITKDNITKQLLGKNMNVLQLNSIPGVVLKIILKQNNIEYVE